MRCYCVIETMCGNLMIVQKENSIVQISFVEHPIHLSYTVLLCKAAQQMHEYFAGQRKAFSFPIALYGTEFQQSVWNALRNIPYGQTKTYKEIAHEIGNEQAMRAVGMANHNNPIAIVVPCHRVIGKSGALVGYAAGLDRKKQLLQLEQENER